MARRRYSSTAVDTALSSAIGAADTSLTVNSDSGYPAVPFVIVLDPDTGSEELVLVGARSGTIFSSLTRGYDGTAAVTHSSGAVVKHVATGLDFDEVWTHDHDTTDGHAQVSHTKLGDLSVDGHPIYLRDFPLVTFGIEGPLVVVAGTTRWYSDIACTIVSVRASVDTAPTGDTVLVDVNKNGATIFTSQAKRPEIAISGNTDVSDTPDVVAVAVGDYFQVDVDQVGSTEPGHDLVVTILARRA